MGVTTHHQWRGEVAGYMVSLMWLMVDVLHC